MWVISICMCHARFIVHQVAYTPSTVVSCGTRSLTNHGISKCVVDCGVPTFRGCIPPLLVRVMHDPLEDVRSMVWRLGFSKYEYAFPVPPRGF